MMNMTESGASSYLESDHGDSHGSRTRQANLRAAESGRCEPRAVTVVEIRMPSLPLRLPVRMHPQAKGDSERALQLEADGALDSEAEICQC